jgi:poly-gamma-glutamate capsule biosynthesis protein CapA/YwtB (metallophosphatase superfamily)
MKASGVLHGLISLLLYSVAAAGPPPHVPTGIENFDAGSVILTSYPGEDQQPSGWTLDSLVTHNDSPYALRLTGNTWKIEAIAPVRVDSGGVWRLHALIEQTGEIQGFGLRDSAHELLFAFAGSEEVDPAAWVTVYQGAFATGGWTAYLLPVADEWLARFGYLPTISQIIFINDRDSDPSSAICFDDIVDITPDLPFAPDVSITFVQGPPFRDVMGRLSVDIQFTSHVVDPDSGMHTFFWMFGDDSTSTAEHPHHTYLVTDDHPYRVLLEVTDATALCGRASRMISVDPGQTSFPVTMTFVGDIMLARNYEAPGGIIPTRGVDAIFAPTRPLLNDGTGLTVANLECPLTQSGTPHPTKPIVFRGSPANATGLVYAGIDVVSMANNHVMDYGEAGMRETQSTLRQRGIAYSGAGGTAAEACEPRFVTRSGLTFAFLAYSDRTGQYNNYQPYLDAGANKPGFAGLTPFEVARGISRVRNDADIVVVEMHSGAEYSTVPVAGADLRQGDEGYTPDARAPLESDRAIRRQTLDDGADIVICHHPHITQGFEVHRGKLIAHSLGNFAFDLGYSETFPSVVLKAAVGPSGISSCTVEPVYIDDYIPTPARGDLGRYMLDDLAMKSRDLGTTLVVDRTAVRGTILLDSISLTPRMVTRTASIALRQQGTDWVSAPFRLPRNGSLQQVADISPAGGWSVRYGREVLWIGNCEDEGCTLWERESSDELFDTTVSHSGHRSLMQRRSAGAATVVTSLEQRLVGVSAAPYSVCGWVRTSGGRNVTADVKMYSTRSGLYELGSGNIGTTVQGTSDWTLLSADFTSPTGTAFLDIELSSSGPAIGTGYAWFDDLGIVSWTAWSAPGTTVPAPNDYAWLQIRTPGPATFATVSWVEQLYVDPGAEASIDVPLIAGWNMVSNPVTVPESLMAVNRMYPGSSFDHAFTFASTIGYVQSPLLANGKGYWAKFPSDQTASIHGSRRRDDTVGVFRGWNMIGSVSDPIDTAALMTSPAGLLASVVYGYGPGYAPAAAIAPGRSYWVKCADSGRVFFSSLLPAAARHRKPAMLPDGTLAFRDATGASSRLLVLPRGADEARFDLPPLPPDHGWDVRFTSGRMAVCMDAGRSVHPLVISGARHPVMVTWETEGAELKAGLHIGKTMVNLRPGEPVPLAGGSDTIMIVLEGRDDRLPTTYELAQNYPNPFNPATTIRYALPEPAGVDFAIFSITGQRVRTLASGDQQAGYYAVAWDGVNDAGLQVGSGVYFARLVAGSYRQSRKLLLLR